MTLLQDAVTQYLASGGTVTAVPGFSGIKPMPPRAAPQKRQAIIAEAESAKAISANVASYAKKQRDKRELAQEWKELGNAAP